MIKTPIILTFENAGSTLVWIILAGVSDKLSPAGACDYPGSAAALTGLVAGDDSGDTGGDSYTICLTTYTIFKWPPPCEKFKIFETFQSSISIDLPVELVS